MANKFQSFGFGQSGGDPTNGTLDLFGKSLKATNLSPDSAVITNGQSKLATTSLASFTPQGTDGDIQFKTGGLHDADPALNWDNTAKALQLLPFSDGPGDTTPLKFFELAGTGSNFIAFKAADTMATSETFTWPNGAGLPSQVLSMPFGAGNALEWATKVEGPGTSNDLRIVLMDGTDGDQIQQSVFSIDGDEIVAPIDFNVTATAGNIRFASAVGSTGISAPLGLQLEAHGGGAGETTELQLFELAANGTNKTGFKAPDALAGDVIYTMPLADGSAGQVWTTNGSAVLSFQTAALPSGYMNGLLVSDNAAFSKNITLGRCRDSTDAFDIISIGVLIFNIGNSGANGLDTGAEAANTWYAIFVIADTTGASAVASLLSLSATAPTLPGTYDVFRRIGWVRNDASSDFLDYFSQSQSRDRVMTWVENFATLQVLSNGASITYATVSLASLVPPTCRACHINTNHEATGNGDFAVFVSTADGLVGTSPAVNARPLRCYSGASGTMTASTFFLINPDSTQNIDYANSSAAEETDIWVIAYIDSL